MKEETAKQEKKRDKWALKENITNFIAYTVLAFGTLLTVFIAAVLVADWIYNKDENNYIQGDIYVDNTEFYWMSATVILVVAAATWFAYKIIKHNA